MPSTVPLDPRTAALLEILAARRSQTRSEVIRDAIEALANRDAARLQGERPSELVADLIGCIEGGPSDLSEHTGRRFRMLLGGSMEPD